MIVTILFTVVGLAAVVGMFYLMALAFAPVI